MTYTILPKLEVGVKQHIGKPKKFGATFLKIYLKEGKFPVLYLRGITRNHKMEIDQKKAISILVTITIVEGTRPFVHAH